LSTAQVKKCFGCGHALKPGGQIGEPPWDLVIVSNAIRKQVIRCSWRSERNALECLLPCKHRMFEKKQAYFLASLVPNCQSLRKLDLSWHQRIRHI
jgi:hypothetical protein